MRLFLIKIFFVLPFTILRLKHPSLFNWNEIFHDVNSFHKCFTELNNVTYLRNQIILFQFGEKCRMMRRGRLLSIQSHRIHILVCSEYQKPNILFTIQPTSSLSFTFSL